MRLLTKPSVDKLEWVRCAFEDVSESVKIEDVVFKSAPPFSMRSLVNGPLRGCVELDAVLEVVNGGAELLVAVDGGAVLLVVVDGGEVPIT